MLRNQSIEFIHVMTFYVCVQASTRARERERERERERGGEEKPGINENWCVDSGRMYKVKIRNHKYMNPVGTT